MQFDELLYNYDLLDALDDMRFSECTPIQEQAIPVAEEGRDLIAVAQTGTGKTAAYLLPVLDRLADGGYPTDAVNCLVMAPTRELALQIDQQLQGFSYYLPGISSTAIYGGTDGKTFSQQKTGLVKGADIVIATPGRLIAHMQMGYVDLSQVSFFILDEADRMLDMGFYEDIMSIASALPTDRQTLMFSATMPPKIKTLAERILHDPVEIKIAASMPAERIDQKAYVVYEPQKEALLKHILKTDQPQRWIIFASSKQKVKQLCAAVRKWHYSVGEMHSDLDQSVREQNMLDFKSGKIDILIATDIVARGIDVDDIAMVINYDVPHEGEDYVHRVGRTARASNSGRALTLISADDRVRFQRIEKLIKREIEKLPLPDSLGEAPAYPAPQRGRQNGRGHDFDGKKNNRHRKPNSQPAQGNANQPAQNKPAQDNANKPVQGKKRRPAHRKKQQPAQDKSNQPT